jgi:hypothetical protein
VSADGSRLNPNAPQFGFVQDGMLGVGTVGIEDLQPPPMIRVGKQIAAMKPNRARCEPNPSFVFAYIPSNPS